MAETKKRKKPTYVEKADEVTKKVDAAVGSTLKNLAKPSKNSKAEYLKKAKAAPVDTLKEGKPRNSHGLARPQKVGSYPRKAQPMGTAFNGTTPKATPSYDGKASSASPKTRKPAAKAGGGESDYYSGPKTRKPLSNPGSAGKTKQPVKAGQDPNAEWRRAQLTGQGDRWDATRGKMKRAGSNR